jgi:hypothetical protein
MEAAAEEWRSSVEAGQKGADLFGERYFEVRYERLLADPGEGIQKLFEWLELDVGSELLDGLLEESRSEFNVDPSSPGIRTDKWKDGLSAQDLATFERVAGHLLEPLGCEREALERPAATESLGETARSAAHSARHLRSALRSARERWRAKEALRSLMGNYDIVEDFQQAVSRGKLDAARELLAPNLKARVSTEAQSSELRGAPAIDALLAALTEHDAEGARALSGTVHSSPTAFTIVTVYETSGQRRWSRTVVLVVGDGKIHDATLYRFPVAAGAAVPG